MPDVLHISDLHFGPPYLPDRAEAVHDLAAEEPPDVVVVSGDLTQRAKRRQFEEAAAYLDRFEVPVVVTPGNHDVPFYRVWERFLSPHGLYREYISDELDTAIRVGRMTVVALNSTRRLTLDNGRLDRDQLEFAARVFEEAPDDDLRAVVTHHHLAPPPAFSGHNVMPRAKRALDEFRRQGVDLVLAGHMHRAYIGDSLDFFPGGDREEGIVIVQCGTTTSARGRGRERFTNSLNYLRARPGRVEITHYLWRGAARGFWPHSRHRFGLSPRIWLGATPAPFHRNGE
ncbi:MAG: metallophosphoesterase family protein [Gemmatimonadota bacterium]